MKSQSITNIISSKDDLKLHIVIHANRLSCK